MNGWRLLGGPWGTDAVAGQQSVLVKSWTCRGAGFGTPSVDGWGGGVERGTPSFFSFASSRRHPVGMKETRTGAVNLQLGRDGELSRDWQDTDSVLQYSPLLIVVEGKRAEYGVYTGSIPSKGRDSLEFDIGDTDLELR